MRTCKICGGEHHAKGYCKHHYGTVYVKSEAFAEDNGRCMLILCEDPHHSRGLCSRHYQQWYMSGRPDVYHGHQIPEKRPGPAPKVGCDVEGCEDSHHGLGYCYNHYRRFKKWGSPTYYAKHPGYPDDQQCWAPYCDRTDIEARGLCGKHYRRWNYRKKNWGEGSVHDVDSHSIGASKRSRKRWDNRSDVSPGKV